MFRVQGSGWKAEHGKARDAGHGPVRYFGGEVDVLPHSLHSSRVLASSIVYIVLVV